MTPKPRFGPAPNSMVYIKTVLVSDLPDDLRENAGDRATIFSVHDEKGLQLALVADRQLAFQLARQHNMVPVAVH